MRKRIAFGPLTPDIPSGDHLVIAENVYARAKGYGPVGSFQAITPALEGLTGGAAFVGSDGTSALLAGDATDLYRYSGGSWSSVLADQVAVRWRFAQFGDNVIAVNGAAPVSFDIAGGTAAVLAGDPPNADIVATVRDFVVLAGDPDSRLTVTWSGFNNSTEWEETVNQSGSQEMLDGGEVMGIAGGESGIILQRQAIKRMSYEGAPLVFRFDEISSNVGCMAKGSVAQAGRLVFFLSERGFMMCDGNEARPIGAEKIDRTFFAAYSRAEIEEGIYAAVDPRRFNVIWSMPGNPGQLWVYNWSLDRWTTVSLAVSSVFSGFTANVSIDAIDAEYPGGLDTIPVSLDDPVFAGGNPLLLVADAAGVVGTLTGDPLPALIGNGEMELESGRCRVRELRPITDATAVEVLLDGRARAGDPPMQRVSQAMRPSGAVPIRVNGRSFRLEVEITSGVWTFLDGTDIDYELAGQR